MQHSPGVSPQTATSTVMRSTSPSGRWPSGDAAGAFVDPSSLSQVLSSTEHGVGVGDDDDADGRMGSDRCWILETDVVSNECFCGSNESWLIIFLLFFLQEQHLNADVFFFEFGSVREEPQVLIQRRLYASRTYLIKYTVRRPLSYVKLAARVAFVESDSRLEVMISKDNGVISGLKICELRSPFLFVFQFFFSPSVDTIFLFLFIIVLPSKSLRPRPTITLL